MGRNVLRLYFPLLRSISADLTIEGSNLDSVVAPELTRLEKLTVNNNTRLNNVSMPVLVVVGQTLDVQSNALLNSLDLPSLRNIRPEKSVGDRSIGNHIVGNFSRLVVTPSITIPPF